MNLKDTILELGPDGCFNLKINGGAEYGQFIFIADDPTGKANISFGHLTAGEIIIEINGVNVAGYPRSEVLQLIQNCNSQLNITSVLPNHSFTIDLRHYMKKRFTQGSYGFHLQSIIRENVITRTVVCTTREPRGGEVPGKEYKFITPDEYYKLESSRKFLESSFHESYYYGIPFPPKQPGTAETGNISDPKMQKNMDEQSLNNIIFETLSSNILQGLQPVSVEDAIKLAAYQLQIKYGDYYKSKYSSENIDVRDCLPKEYHHKEFNLKSSNREKIKVAHHNIFGMDAPTAKEKYIQFCKNLKTFGITEFFTVTDKSLATFKLGIHKERVILLDGKKKTLLEDCPLALVGCNSKSDTSITLDFGCKGTGSKWITDQGEEIWNIISVYRDIEAKNTIAEAKYQADDNIASSKGSPGYRQQADDPQSPQNGNDQQRYQQSLQTDIVRQSSQVDADQQTQQDKMPEIPDRPSDEKLRKHAGEIAQAQFKNAVAQNQQASQNQLPIQDESMNQINEEKMEIGDDEAFLHIDKPEDECGITGLTAQYSRPKDLDDCIKNTDNVNNYEQLRNNIVKGIWPVKQEEAIQLAVYQVQIQYGNFNEHIYEPGTLDWIKYLPPEYVHKVYVQNKIKEEHQLILDMDTLEAMKKFNQMCQDLKTYGMIFFQLQEKPYYKSCLLGIGNGKVTLFEKESKNIIKSCSLERVQYYASDSNLTINFGDSKSKREFYTAKGLEIIQLINGNRDNLNKDKNISRKKEEHGTEFHVNSEGNRAKSSGQVGKELSYLADKLEKSEKLMERGITESKPIHSVSNMQNDRQDIQQNNRKADFIKNDIGTNTFSNKNGSADKGNTCKGSSSYDNTILSVQKTPSYVRSDEQIGNSHNSNDIHAHSTTREKMQNSTQDKVQQDVNTKWDKCDAGSLQEGSMAEVQFMGISYYGVIKWIGYDESCPDKLLAGLEIEEESLNLPGLTFGTFQGRHKFYSPLQRALFTPLQKCKPDSRFSIQSSPAPLKEGGGNSVEGSVLPPAKLKENFIGRDKGIQGDCNSCYMDATLFAMFAYALEFDTLLNRKRRCYDIENYENVQRILKEKIVNPLRKDGQVLRGSVYELREYLDKLGSVGGFMGQEKDPEEFIVLLLEKVLKVDPFIKMSATNNQEQCSHLYQIFVPKEERNPLPSVQYLLESSFLYNQLRLAEMPSVMVLQMPRSGQQKIYKRIQINSCIDVSHILKDAAQECIICGSLATCYCEDCTCLFGWENVYTFLCENCSHLLHDRKRRDHRKHYFQKSDSLRKITSEDPARLELFAVLCIDTSHYVSFVKCGMDDDERWLFFDSMADRIGEENGYNIPEVSRMDDLETYLNGTPLLISELDKKKNEKLLRVFEDSFLCFYRNTTLSMYK